MSAPRLWVLLGITFVVAGFVGLARSATAHEEIHRTGYYTWGMQIDMPSGWDPGLSNGALTWDNVTLQCHDFVQKPSGVSAHIVQDKYWIDGKYGIVAETNFSHSAIFYDTAETWHQNVNTSPGPNSIDLWSIAAHEMGHTLAIGTHLSPPNTMQQINPSQNFYGTTFLRTLEGDEIFHLRNMYPPGSC